MTKGAVSVISMASNFVLGLFKVFLGLTAKSSALLAEGLHSATDVVSSAIAFWGVRVAGRKPSKTHPYGWARAEVLAGLAVAVFLGLAGLQIVREAAGKILSGEHEAAITLLPLLVMILSVVTSEILARLKIRVGQREESLALIADGKHSRVDVLSSMGVLVGLISARFFPIADSVVALLAGLYILYETIILGKEVTENLLDVADLDAEEEIRRVCQKEQVDLAALKTRKIGALTFAELEVSVPTEVKVGRVDDLISELQGKLVEQIPRLEYVVVQIKGIGKRMRRLRGRCAETLERVGPKKVGRRVVTPYREGKPYGDFGAPEYLVVDRGKVDEELLREVVENPYYKIGRGHGVRFVQAVQADGVRTANIGENARGALGELGIKILEDSDL